MVTEDDDSLNEDSWDEWEDFRHEDPTEIGIEAFRQLNLSTMPEDASFWFHGDDFPQVTVWRDDESLVYQIEEHLYTKYWEHKFSAYAFAESMERAVRRLAHEGHPVSNPEREADDVHIFVRWSLQLPRTVEPDMALSAIKSAFDLVWRRADAILENSDSVLVLGKDTGPALERLTRIADRLQELGYYTYIIKEQPDKFGESIIQKVLRYALSSKFVLIENTEPSGHLYEIPHVMKAAECVTAVLQEQGKGATWMFEDGYAKHNHWHKVMYQPSDLDQAVDAAVKWAEQFVRDFGAHQAATLPWMKAT